MWGSRHLIDCPQSSIESSCSNRASWVLLVSTGLEEAVVLATEREKARARTVLANTTMFSTAAATSASVAKVYGSRGREFGCESRKRHQKNSCCIATCRQPGVLHLSTKETDRKNTGSFNASHSKLHNAKRILQMDPRKKEPTRMRIN